MNKQFGGENIGKWETLSAAMARYSALTADCDMGQSEALVAMSKCSGRCTTTFRCFNCNRRGHLARDCLSKVKKNEESSSPFPPADRDFAAPSCVADSQSNICFIGGSFLTSVDDAAKRWGVQGAKGSGQDRASQGNFRLTVVLPRSSRTKCSIAGEMFFPSKMAPNLISQSA